MLAVTLYALLGLALVIALGFAWVYWKEAPTLQNRVTAAAMTLMMLLLIACVAIMIVVPNITRTADELTSKVSEVRMMSTALGGPENYIEYLKAIKE